MEELQRLQLKYELILILAFAVLRCLGWKKVGNSKVCLAVVSIKQQSGLVLKLLITFGVVNLTVGNFQHAKGDEAGERGKLHSLVAYLAPALNALCPVIASSSTP